MKIELEQNDIEGIAIRIVTMLKPYLKGNNKTASEDMIFDVQSLSEYLKVDDSWIYKQVSLKTIPYFKCGKYTRFKKSRIDKWIEEESIQPIPPFSQVKHRE